MAAKQIDLALALKAQLVRKGYTVTDTVDSSNNAALALGAGTAGSQSAYIKVKPIDSIGTDSIGLTQRSFGPHVIQVVLETSTIANVSLLTGANLLAIMGCILPMGTRVELYMSANTNAVGPEDIVSGNLKATWDGSALEFGVMAAV